jgi:iron complex transport system permease protein
MQKYSKAYYILAISFIALFFGNLVYGSVNIPAKEVMNILFGGESPKASWSMIILNSRLPQCITALLSGASLAISGLLLQTLFRNPLAGPSILGISDGANLGVAAVMLYTGGVIGGLGGGGYLTIVLAALAGSLAVLAIIIWFSQKVKSNVMLLIIGIMIGYLASSLISILNYHASADKVHQFVMWGMGDFSGVSLEKLPYFTCFTVVGLIYSLLLIKPLNALLLGEMYAANLGINVRRARISILLCTGILTATITAFCGPVSFIGLAVPHVARMLLGTSNHKHLVPVTILSGACIALLCNMLTVVPGSSNMLPLNAVTPMIGAPIIIYVIVNRKNLQYFN